MPINSISSFTTPPARRESIKKSDRLSEARAKRKDALREFGRQQRHAILQQHRHSLSPVDLKGNLHAHTMAAIRNQLIQPEPDVGVLTDADMEALLQDIEQQVLEDIQAELAELERHNQEQMQHEASMAEQHMQQSAQGDDSGVLCPVCKCCELVLRQGLLVCPRQGWRVNLAAESISMDQIRSNLATAYQDHAATACPGQLTFQIEDLFGSGDSLTCNCATCNTLAVVV